VREKLRFRKIHLRVSRAGALFIGFTLVAGVVAVNSGNNLLFILVAALLSLFSLSGILAFLNIRGLDISLRAPGEVFAGRPATVGLELTNRKRRLPSFLLTCEGDRGGEVITELRPNESMNLKVRTTFFRRGRQPLEEMVLTSEFPFGLVRRGGSFAPESTCIVYPEPKPVKWEIVEEAEREGEDRSSPLAGVGGDYRGQRAYVPGDSLSRVQWKGWLRHRRLMTKEFESEGASPVVFSYASVPGPGREERLSQLSWLVKTAFRRGRAVGLVLPGRTFSPATGSLHRQAVLTALALFGENGADAKNQPLPQ
jgi:uncharacterized protein (DUF58 family)